MVNTITAKGKAVFPTTSLAKSRTGLLDSNGSGIGFTLSPSSDSTISFIGSTTTYTPLLPAVTG